MMPHLIRIISFVLLASCVNHDLLNTSAKEALAGGSILCKKSVDEMEWLKTLLQQSEADPALRGDIYAAPIDGTIIFVHQPLIMSCLACVLYDCDGNRIAAGSIAPEKLIAGMKPVNLIYRPF